MAVNKNKLNIPTQVTHVTKTLEAAGFEAFLVGGCTRDIFLGRTPKDWDVTTNATPDQIIALFPKTFYENSYGTVGVVDETTEDEQVKIIEVTPYRVETSYTDFRRPDSVSFSTKIEDDLKRRDFTINAVAVQIKDSVILKTVDMFGGVGDLMNKIIKTVENPNDRFTEDALRILRAIRLATELGFTINTETAEAIKKNAHLLGKIANERVRDEFNKILLSDKPMEGIILAHKLDVLKYVAPELEQGIGVEQTQAHSFDVWEHLLRSLQCAADKRYELDIRIAALFHDISKPETRRFSHETKQFTFYGHEVVGSRVTKKILERLKYSTKTIERVTKLVRWHMFFSDTENITLSAVRRMITNVGRENIWDLMNVRICDRIGTGRPKENPYRLRKYHAMIEEALRDPVTVGMLKIDGKRLMEVTKIAPGPKIGYVLHALLEEVLEDPKLNTSEYLEKRGGELLELPENELRAKGEEGKEKKDELDEELVQEIRKKHHVK